MRVTKGGGSYKIMNVAEKTNIKNGCYSSTREQKRAFKRQLKAEAKRKALYEEKKAREWNEIRTSFYKIVKNFFLGI